MFKFLFQFILFLACSFFVNISFAQDPRLATQYFQNGEFEKAAEVYLALRNKHPNNEYYFTSLIDCYMQMENYDEASKLLKKELEKNSTEPKLYMSYGNLLERIGKPEEAEKQYEKAVTHIKPDRNSIITIASQFVNNNKLHLASAVYEKGTQLLPGDRTFSYNLADLYRKQGNEERMIYHYLDALEGNQAYQDAVKTVFQRFLDDSGHKELQKQLYERIQKNQENPLYPELLSWLFVLKKDYPNAFRQLRAIDRRMGEDGLRVFNLAYTASYEQEYDVALEAFQYIIEEKGRNSKYYLEALKGKLNVSRKKIMNKHQGDKIMLQALEIEYQKFLDEFGSNAATAAIISELAELQAYYLNDLDAAIATLNSLLSYRSVNSYILANAKLDLGDFYLMKGERWESTLLYSQVDKDFGDEVLGQEARFRNARLSYFVGDFEWAQSQFDILKSATSRFISNDAIDLSVFIMDNIGLDSTDQPLRLYANAELLVFQNRFEEAKNILQELRTQFPQHKLEDDILYLEAEIFMKNNNYKAAAEKYEAIATQYPEEIRADNSIFNLGEIYELHLNNPDKAREYYERIVLEYSNSILAIEARKRYRLLRGDNI
jgi:tetratricopeptide (TPR) repeat protein